MKDYPNETYFLVHDTNKMCIRDRGNIDATVLAQAPKLRPYIDAMRDRLAAACGVDAGRIGIKATTEEGLGFTGDGSGMAAHAVVLLEQVSKRDAL